MSLKYAIVSNPHSKFNQNGLIDWVNDKFNGAAHFVRPLEKYPKMIEDIVREKADAIIVSSGDGGIHKFLTAAQEAWDDLPPLILPPSGTFNLQAGVLGHRGVISKPRRVLKRVLRLNDIESREQNWITIDDGEETKVGFCLANGIVANFFDIYNQDPGVYNGVKLIAKYIRAFLLRDQFREDYEQIFREYNMKFTIDNLVIEGSYHGFASHCSNLGVAGLKLPYQGNLQLSATTFTKETMLENLARVFTRRPLTGEVEHSGQKVTIENCGRYIIDGDSYQADRIELGLKSLEVVVL